MGGEALQGLVQGQQLLGRPAGLEGVEVRVLAAPATAVLHPALAAGVLDQDAAHGLGGRGEEVAPAVPGLAFLLADQAQVDLVDQGGGLERVAGTLMREPGGRKFLGGAGVGIWAAQAAGSSPDLPAIDEVREWVRWRGKARRGAAGRHPSACHAGGLRCCGGGRGCSLPVRSHYPRSLAGSR